MPGITLNYRTSVNLDFSGLSKLDMSGSRGAPQPRGPGQPVGSSGCCHRTAPAEAGTNATQEVNSHTGGKGHLHQLSISQGEWKTEDQHTQFFSAEETSSTGLSLLFSTNNMYNGIIIIQWLHQTKQGICSYVAGKLPAVTVQEHALNSLCNELNLLLQPVLQNCLSILALNPKKASECNTKVWRAISSYISKKEAIKTCTFSDIIKDTGKLQRK